MKLTYDAGSFWVQDSVRFALLAIAAHFPFSGRGVELRGVLYMTKVLTPITQRCEKSASSP